MTRVTFSDARWAVIAMLTGLCVGGLAVLAPQVLLVVPAAAVTVAVYRRPTAAPLTVVLACAMYAGIYLAYRVRLGSVPVSLLNLLPFIALVAACSVAMRYYKQGLFSSRFILPLLLLASGLGFGSLLGIAKGADGYQLMRAVTVEASLCLGCIAGLLAGGSRSWQRATVTAFYAVGTFAALQQIGSFLYLVAVGHSFWEMFAFGEAAANVEQALLSGTVAGTRDNFIPTFIMLPALTLSVYRLKASDMGVATLIVVAVALSLSRGFWVAAAIGVGLALVARALSGRTLRLTTALRIAVVLVAAFAALSTFAGDVINSRIQESGTQTDLSLRGRQAESSAAFNAITSSPLSFVGGIGAGVVLAPTTALVQSNLVNREPTSLLENQLLGRWANFGLLSVLGAIGLLFGVGFMALRALVKRRPDVDHDLLALGLALVPLLAVSPFSGTLLSLNLSLPYWMLGGTILAALWGAQRERPTATPSAPIETGEHAPVARRTQLARH